LEAEIIILRHQLNVLRRKSETGKRRFASECVVVDAARCEPVSATKFP
jgi:hypothetical protein